jgi:hypothetical protein
MRAHQLDREGTAAIVGTGVRGEAVDQRFTPAQQSQRGRRVRCLQSVRRVRQIEKIMLEACNVLLGQ